MSSCNVQSVNLEIIPTSRGTCTWQTSCNVRVQASGNAAGATSSGTVGCAEQASCNVHPLLRGWRFQYPGWAARHCRTRSTFSAPRKWSTFSGLLNQRCCLARLLAVRHSGVEQYSWRPRFRQSGTNNFLQCTHLQRRVSGFIRLKPPPIKAPLRDDKREQNPPTKKTEK
jgi:hypothetical protein